MDERFSEWFLYLLHGFMPFEIEHRSQGRHAGHADRAFIQVDRIAAMTAEERHHDAFVRWQQISIEHLGHSINLLITLATALLAFVVSLIIDEKIQQFYWAKMFLRAGLAFLLFSIFSGLLATTFFRVDDFRGTALTVALRAKAPGSEQLDELRERTHMLGQATRGAFGTQRAMFLFATMSLLISFLIQYGHRI